MLSSGGPSRARGQPRSTERWLGLATGGMVSQLLSLTSSPGSRDEGDITTTNPPPAGEPRIRLHRRGGIALAQPPPLPRQRPTQPQPRDVPPELALEPTPAEPREEALLV